MPTAAMSNRFSTGSTCNVDIPFGVHKLWQNCEESTCLAAIGTSALHSDIFPSDPEKNDDDTKFCKEGDILYLYFNPDIAEAVKKGEFKNGFQHWSTSGRHESRQYRCPFYPEVKYQQKDVFEVDKKYFQESKS